MRHNLVHIGGPDDDRQILDRWFRETATILQGIRYHEPEYRPFQEMETASVSLLLGAAASSGYYPISEYRTTKRHLDGKKDSQSEFARGDLWFVAGGKSYAFEFKRAWDVSTTNQLRSCLDAAVKDVDRIIYDEADHYYAIVTAPLVDEDCLKNYQNFDNANWIATIVTDKPEVFIYLKKVVYE